MPIYNPKDVFIVQRNSTSSSFEEVVLRSQPNTYVSFDSASNLVPTSEIISTSSSYADTASYALNSSPSASYLNKGANIYLSQSYIYADVSASVPPTVEGQLWWDSANHTYTIDALQSRLQIGQENYVKVLAGEFIPEGYAVYLNGVGLDPNNSTTKIPICYLALADGTGSKSSVVGLSTQQINVGESGFITTQGIVNEINTFLFSDGDVLYLSSTQSGSYDVNIPVDPYEKVIVGTVLYSHPTIGKILVDISILPIHNNLNLLQGGTGSQYYHLTEQEYSGSGTGIFVRQSGSVITGSISNADSSSYALSSSWTPTNITVDSASLSLSSSYLVPGATLYVVSSSTNPSYIEPYNIPTVPYNPPYKEGRMFYDKDYSNWVYYTDQDFKLHIGKEVIWRVYNANGSTLATGTPVYISGSTNGLDPDVWPAIADSTNLKSDIVGVMRYTTPSGSTGYVMQGGVIHGIDMTGFSIGDAVYLSNTTLGGIINYDPGYPYENVNIGNCQVAGVSGSIVVSPTFKSPSANAYSGITVSPVIVSNESGSIYISTGSVNLYDGQNGFGLPYGFPLNETTLSLITGSTNYLIAKHSGSGITDAWYEITTDDSYANGINIVRVATFDVYTGDPPGSEWDVHQFDVGIIGLALANRINNKDIELYGYQRRNGLTLYVTGSSGSFGITEGTIWYGPNSHVIQTFDTTLNGHYIYIFHTSGSGWYQSTSSIFQTGVYDSGAGSASLNPCAPDSWSVNFVYRLVGTDDEAGIVMSSEQFATEIEASNNATTPPNLPSTIRDISLLVGRFVVQSGSYNPTIESAFSNTFIPAVVTDHESLLGLQGGTGGQHNHLTNAEYLGTGTGVFVKANRPSFVGATVGHVPYWDSLQRLTLTGSLQVVDDKHVLINSASLPDNPADHAGLLVRQIESSSNNVIGGYATVNDFSQFYNQNLSTGSGASTDIVATSDIGSQTSSYIDVGIASSNYNSPIWPWVQPLDGYLEIDGGDLWVGTLTDNRLKFVFNNTASTNYADKTGFYLSGSFYGTSSRAVSSTSSSYSLTASHAEHSTTSSFAESASWAQNSFGSTSSSFASQSFSASYALSASWTFNSITASHAAHSTTSSFAISSSWAPFQVSASWASRSFAATSASFASQSFNATSASFASQSVSSSYSTTTSFAFGVPTIKAGITSGSTFVGNPKTASIVFTNPFPNNNYSVTIAGESSRTWTVQSKDSGSFVINSNNNTAFTNLVFWQAIKTGEYYS